MSISGELQTGIPKLGFVLPLRDDADQPAIFAHLRKPEPLDEVAASITASLKYAGDSAYWVVEGQGGRTSE